MGSYVSLSYREVPTPKSWWNVTGVHRVLSHAPIHVRSCGTSRISKQCGRMSWTIYSCSDLPTIRCCSLRLYYRSQHLPCRIGIMSAALQVPHRIHWTFQGPSTSLALGHILVPAVSPAVGQDLLTQLLTYCRSECFFFGGGTVVTSTMRILGWTYLHGLQWLKDFLMRLDPGLGATWFKAQIDVFRAHEWLPWGKLT